MLTCAYIPKQGLWQEFGRRNEPEPGATERVMQQRAAIRLQVGDGKVGRGLFNAVCYNGWGDISEIKVCFVQLINSLTGQRRITQAVSAVFPGQFAEDLSPFALHNRLSLALPIASVRDVQIVKEKPPTRQPAHCMSRRYTGDA